MNINLDFLTPSTLEAIYNAVKNSLANADEKEERDELTFCCDEISRAYEALTGEDLK